MTTNYSRSQIYNFDELTENEQLEVMNKGKKWADANGYDRLRISVVDLSIPPNFTKAITV